ncbi:MAG: large subunit ribosomal protein L10 [Glomeribacter sp. 1016415]|nr:large subunit ribosomal protein L10 [Glomeribacter sp. 1016415]
MCNITDIVHSIWSLTVPLNREDKQAVVAEVAAKVAQAQTMVLAEYRGITVGDLTRLRAQAREQQVYLRVLKNTLVRRAVADTPFASLTEQMTGPLIYGISEDAIAAAKVLHTFAKSNDKLVIRSGIYEGKVMDQAAVQALATIPSREELLAKLLGVMQAPISGFARALAALSEKKQSEAQSEPA